MWLNNVLLVLFLPAVGLH